MRTIISKIPTGARFKRGQYCIPIGYPFLTRGAIIALEEILRSDFSVLELGSGGSTIFFSDRCKMVKSFDFDQRWVDKLKERMGERNGVEILCGDHNFVLESINNEPDEKYDLALIDIGKDSVPRVSLAYACMPKVKKRRYMVIDNYAAKGLNTLDCTGWSVFTFDELINRSGNIRTWNGTGTRILIKQ